jgi:hypothetical protein
MLESDTKYFWMICKVCGKLHRGSVFIAELDGFGRQAVPPHGKLECPENPGKFADYEYTDWRVAAELEINGTQPEHLL